MTAAEIFKLSVEEYIWAKAFPNEDFDIDDFYDWSKENAGCALSLALEYCQLIKTAIENSNPSTPTND